MKATKEMTRENTTLGHLFEDSFGVFIRETKKLPSLSRVQNWLSLLWCVPRHGVSPADYVYYKFNERSERERATYLTMIRFERFLKKVNTGDHEIFHNKLTFCEKYNTFLHRPWLDMNKTDFDSFAAFVQSEGTVICKPVDKSGGHGIFKYTCAPGEDLHPLFERCRGMLLERVIEQHPAMAAYNPNCVNALRLVTLIDRDGAPHLVDAFFRTGVTEAVVDNLCSGGIISHIDLDTGIVANESIGLNMQEFLRHPYSGEIIPGFQIPYWKEAVALVLEAALITPDVRWVGWDVAVTAEGVCLVEGNDRAECRSLQMADRKGLRPAVSALI